MARCGKTEKLLLSPPIAIRGRWRRYDGESEAEEVNAGRRRETSREDTVSGLKIHRLLMDGAGAKNTACQITTTCVCARRTGENNYGWMNLRGKFASDAEWHLRGRRNERDLGLNCHRSAFSYVLSPSCVQLA